MNGDADGKAEWQSRTLIREGKLRVEWHTELQSYYWETEGRREDAKKAVKAAIAARLPSQVVHSELEQWCYVELCPGC